MTADEFKNLRKQMGKTQSQMAQYLGVSQEMVSEIESGARAVPEEIAVKLGKSGIFSATDTNYGQPLTKQSKEEK